MTKDREHIIVDSVFISRRKGGAMSSDDKENLYVFHIKTGKENEAAEELSRIVAKEKVVPLNYSVEKIFRRQGKTSKEVKPLFPGYLFVRSSMGNEEFIHATWEYIRRSKNIIRLLQYGDSNVSAVKREERDLLLKLLQDTDCIRTSRGYFCGEKVIITDGPFCGRESIIKRVNRHKRQAMIELQIMGEVRSVMVGLEIIARYKELQ